MYKCSCGKEYKRLKPFHNHRATCELLKLSKTSNEDVSHLTNLDTPSTFDMWLALQTALKKIEKLEKKIESQQRWITRQRKKVCVIDWLNENCKPNIIFTNWYKNLEITSEDLNLIFKHDFIMGINYILQKKLPIKSEKNFPIRSFQQKIGELFTFNGESWELLDIDEFSRMIDFIHKKIHSVFVHWNKLQQKRIDYGNNVDETYYKNISKVMGGRYSREETLRKIKIKIYNYLKFNLKNIVQYEFTF